MPPGGIRTHDLSRRAAADLRLRPRGYWDRHFLIINIFISTFCALTKNKAVIIERSEFVGIRFMGRKGNYCHFWFRDRKLEVQVQTNYLRVNRRIIFKGTLKK